MKKEVDAQDGDTWTVYKDGSMFKTLPKSLFTEEELKAIWTARYPDALIVVK